MRDHPSHPFVSGKQAVQNLALLAVGFRKLPLNVSGLPSFQIGPQSRIGSVFHPVIIGPRRHRLQHRVHGCGVAKMAQASQSLCHHAWVLVPAGCIQKLLGVGQSLPLISNHPNSRGPCLGCFRAHHTVQKTQIILVIGRTNPNRLSKQSVRYRVTAIQAPNPCV